MLAYEFITEAGPPIAQNGPAPFDQYQLHPLFDPEDPERSSPEVGPVNSIERLKLIIESNCSEMLAAYRQTKRVLYRGMFSSEQVVITNIRPDRKPVEMHPSVHKWLEFAFSRLGLKANRSNSIFCSSSLSTASNWGGNAYVIFVKDGWSGTVFKDVKRGYAFNHLAYGINDALDAIRKVKAIKPIVIEGSEALMNVLRIKYEDVLITGQSYIAIRAYSPLVSMMLGFNPGDQSMDREITKPKVRPKAVGSDPDDIRGLPKRMDVDQFGNPTPTWADTLSKSLPPVKGKDYTQ